MNIHLVVLRRRSHLHQRLLAAANAVSYNIRPDDHIFIYSNLCLDSRDLIILRTELQCEVLLQPLSADEDVALTNLVDVVTANTRLYPNDANMLIDNDGICKRGRAIIIPAYASSFKS